MPRLLLTDAAIKRLPVPETGQRDYWDTQVKGFGLRVSCGGSRTFVINRNKKRFAIGRYGTITLAAARQDALRLKLVQDNPRHTSFAEARERFYARHLSNLKPTTAYEQRNLMERFPFSKPLASLTNEDVLRVLAEMPRGSARSCFNIIRTFLNWCVANDYLERNPLKKSPYKPHFRERLLSDHEVSLIWGESHHHGAFGAIVRALVLTGQRLSQISSLRQDWCNATSGTIHFPAYIMKSNLNHTIPLTDFMRGNLTTFDKPYTSVSNPMAAFRKALPQIPHWTLHDFRRYFSSTMARLKVPIDITEAILDHRSGSRSQIQRIYDRYDRLPEMRAALELYHSHLRQNVSRPT